MSYLKSKKIMKVIQKLVKDSGIYTKKEKIVLLSIYFMGNFNQK